MPDVDHALDDQRRVIGDRIRAQRVRARLTQDEVIRRSGLPRNTLQRIERGETDARLTWLLRIAAAVGVPLEVLLGAQQSSPGK